MADAEHYRAYLLRMWSVEQNEQVVQRVSLEDSHTGELFGFADLALLFDFLKDTVAGTGSAGKEKSNQSIPGVHRVNT